MIRHSFKLGMKRKRGDVHISPIIVRFVSLEKL